MEKFFLCFLGLVTKIFEKLTFQNFVYRTIEQCPSNCGSRPQMGSPEYFVGSLYYWNFALEIPELKCVQLFKQN